MKIAVLHYSYGEVDIIDVTKEQIDKVCEKEVKDGNWKFYNEHNYDERVQCYLSCYCQYDLDDCHYMCDDYNDIQVNYLNHNDFGDDCPEWQEESQELYLKHTPDISPIYKSGDVSIFISNYDCFGDDEEHEMDFDYYDGYAIGQGKDAGYHLLYPTLSVINNQDERLQSAIKAYCRGDSTDNDPIRVDESAIKFGKLIKNN